jgi:hypothetical protein
MHRCMHTYTYGRPRAGLPINAALFTSSISFFLPPSNHVSNKHRQVSMILILRDMFCTDLLLLRRTRRKTKDSLVGVGLFELREVTRIYLF